MRRAGVFVYGDIGRSPRMQNHAHQLSKDYQVLFMGYFQSSPRTQITQNKNITLVDLQINNLQYIRAVSFYLYALARIMLQVVQIVYLLGIKHKNLDFVLVQNPPSIPNLFAIWLASFLGKYQIIIDFHNYGYTILNLNVKNRLIILFAKWYEQYYARKANAFLCVSQQMQQDLKNNWNIDAVVLYDRPVKKAISTQYIDKDIFLQKYNQKKVDENQFLLVSSTSWTKDQDFSILLDALELYDQSPDATKHIRTFITGKGPQKQRYLDLIQQRKVNWKKISVTALWLEPDDYPVLLSICDLGVCLHYSSSGLDLPMKVVDMFGAGIPVLAINFPALPELVQDGKNGFIFNSREQLTKRIISVSTNEKIAAHLKKQVEEESEHTWQKQWQKKFPK